MSVNPDQLPDDPGLPPKLARDLQRLYDAGPAVPAAVDEAILGMARRQLAARAASRWRWRIGFISSAAAAAALLAIVLVVQPWRTGQVASVTPAAAPAAPAAPADPRDLNGDGQVNILDAYLLARRIEEKQALARSLDLNGDGVIDLRDADVLAMASVRGTGVTP